MIDMSGQAFAISERPKMEPLQMIFIKPGQLIRHYKGGLYRVLHQVTIENNGEPAVAYQSIEPLAKPDIWIRPVAEFFEKVSKDDPQPRFIIVAEPTEDALNTYLARHPSLVTPAHLANIRDHYKDPIRHYHGWWKVLDMFQRALDIDIKLTPEQIIAILYMDIVYVPGMTNGVNELLSSKLLASDAPILGSFNLDIATKIIQDTVTHQATIHESRIIQDLDLAILGDDFTHFQVYNQLAYLETRHLVADRKDFDTRRLRYLIELLQVPAPAQTRFYELHQYEDRVYDNVEKLRIEWQALYDSK